MTCSGKKPRYPFGIREEHLIALVMIPLLFSCLFTKPFIVQIEKFNTGFDTQLLIYSGLENQTVSINVSRYVTVGNWSQNGTFTNFTLEICPIAGAPSDITIYWPYTNNSQVMHAGPLVGCEEVDANASGFDPYFQTDSGIIIDAVGLIGGGGAGLLNTTNTMMLREPHMYNTSEAVWYTMLVPVNVPSSLIASLGAGNLSLPEIHGIGYSCYSGDSVRYVYTPAEYINLSINNETFAGLPIALPPIGIINSTLAVYDLPCPAYPAAGKYRAEIKKINITVENQSANFSLTIFDDDFNGPALNTSAWLILPHAGSEQAYYTDNSASGTYDQYSIGTESGIITYYNNSIMLDGNSSIYAAINASNTQLGTTMTDSAGALFFMDSMLSPGTDAQLLAASRGGIIFGNDSWVVMCPDASIGPVATGPATAGWHAYALNFTNSTQQFYFDGALVATCNNATNGPRYVMLSSDPVINALSGNVSTEWANITTYYNNSGPWAVNESLFDDFSAPLNLTRWLPLAVNGSRADYVVNSTQSKLDFYSHSQSGGSAIITYALMPIFSSQDLVSNLSGANLSAYNLSNYSTMSISVVDAGYNISITLNLSEINATEKSAALVLLNETILPTDNASFYSRIRGGFILNGSEGTIMCPDGSILGTGPIPGDVHTIGMVSSNSSFDYYVDGAFAASCPPLNQTAFLTFTPDWATDMFTGGNASVDRVKIDVFASVLVSGNLWYDVPSGFADTDVIVCNCSDRWNVPYDINISSSAPGTMSVRIVNVSYRSLIGYTGGQPNVNLDPAKPFSWQAYESNITNSEVRYQTGIGRSNVQNSNIMMSDIDCANISNSNLTVFIYNSRNLTKVLEDAGMGGISFPIGDRPCGRVENSDVKAGFFISGDIINSTITNSPLMPFADFENANVDIAYLSRGSLVINMTRWAPEMSSYSIPLLSGLPLGCAENTSFGIDGAPNMTIGHSSTSIDCPVTVANVGLMVFDNVTFNNSMHGIRLTMLNSSVAFTNLEDFNILLQQPEVQIMIYGLNTTASGPIVLSPEQQYMDGSTIAFNTTNYTFLEGRNVTITFQNVYSDYPIYYYPDFTMLSTDIVVSGNECNASRCLNRTYDPIAHTLSFTVTNFSSYAIGTAPPPPSPPTSGSSSNDRGNLTWELICPDNLLTMTVLEAGSGRPKDGIRVRLRYIDDSGYVVVGNAYTDESGMALIPITDNGTYEITASKQNYDTIVKTISLSTCAIKPAGEQPPTEQPSAPSEKPGTPSPAQPPPQPPEEKTNESAPIQPTQNTTQGEINVSQKNGNSSSGTCPSFLGLCWYLWAVILVLAAMAAAVIYIMLKMRR